MLISTFSLCMIVTSWIKSAECRKYKASNAKLYLGKKDALRLEIYRHSLALAIKEVFQSEEPDSTHLTYVFPRHSDHQLTGLSQHTRQRNNRTWRASGKCRPPPMLRQSFLLSYLAMVKNPRSGSPAKSYDI